MAGYKYIGSKIYYLKENGNVVLKTGECEGWVLETTKEEDFKNYADLQQYLPEVVDMLQLQFGEYSTEFAECTSFKVDIQTKKLVFDYTPKPPAPNVPAAPSLHERVAKLEATNEEQDLMISELAML